MLKNLIIKYNAIKNSQNDLKLKKILFIDYSQERRKNHNP